MLFASSVHSPEWHGPRVLFVLLQLQNCTGILCDVRKERKKEEVKEEEEVSKEMCVCGGSRPLARVLYKAMRWNGRKEKTDGGPRKEGRS